MSSRFHHAVLTLSTLAVLGASSASARADAPITAVTSDTVEHRVELIRPNPVLLSTGLLTIVGSYTPAIVVAATSDHRGDQYLYIPVAGPWIDMASRGCAPGQTRRCGATTLETAGLATIGVAHLLGVGQVLASIFIPQPRVMTLHEVKPAKLQVTPTMIGSGGYGLSASGAF